MAKQPAPGKDTSAAAPAAKAKPAAPAAKQAAPAAAANPAAPAGGAAEEGRKGRRIGRAVGVREELEEMQEVGSLYLAFREWLRNAPSWLSSAIVHIVVLLILAIITVSNAPQEEETVLTALASDEPVEEIQEIKEEEIQDDLELEQTPTEVSEPVETDNIAEEIEISSVDDVAASAIQVDVNLDVGLEKMPLTDALSSTGSLTGKGLEGRGANSRKALVAARGGNAASEEAVAKALRWLAAQQLPDGGWDFSQLRNCPDAGKLNNARLAATGLALLPFLGAGNTHKKGEYARTVQGGLYYLLNNMKVSPNGGALNHDGGRMYGHGICAIALTEAYGMTQDRWLFQPAQAALAFIEYAQDPVGGGWRYQPRTPGDTSVVGWQLMALKSGHMAYLRVSPRVIDGAVNFLNTAQSDSGAAYGYTGPGRGQATTAIGLLCRMYLGWKKDHPALERGVAFLSKTGPSKGNMYYNYYATQVMAHYEGEPWKKWNPQMRDHLVSTQAKAGTMEGSWYFHPGDHGAERGGRIYCTAMATMILEVYYRHLPIYRKQASEDVFPD